MGIVGGEKLEYYGNIRKVLRFNGHTMPRHQQFGNHYTKKYGIEKLFITFNRGEPAKIIRGLSSSTISSWGIRVPQAILTILAIGALGWFMFMHKISLYSPYVYTLIAYLILCAGFPAIFN